MPIRYLESKNRGRHEWQTAVQRLFALDFREALTLCTVLVAIIAVTDYVTPSELNFTFMYVFVILLACWNLGPKWGIAYTALACVMQVIVLDQIKGEYISAMYFYLDLGNRVFTFLVVITLTVPLRTVYGREKITARVDWLTRIPNLRGFTELLLTEIARYERTGVPFSVAYFDVDDFKAINDRFGHKRGDLLLCGIAETVRRSLRKTDTVARLGGDEFAILFPASDLDVALPVMQRVRAGLDALHQEGGPATFSVGLGAFRRKGLSPDEVIACCDSLMYRAKRDGKKSIASERFFDSSAGPGGSSTKIPDQS
ncbi:MAG TPA: GGDEF domain-containing protein [Burkholderiales bacterium]